MVHRTMGLPHKSEPKNSYCVIWDKSKLFPCSRCPRKTSGASLAPRNENRVLRQCRKTLLRNLLHDVTPERLELSTQ